MDGKTLSNAFLRRLGLDHPLIQAPMAGSTTPALVAAVSCAGGLGSLGAGYFESQAILEQSQEIGRLTERPWAGTAFLACPESSAAEAWKGDLVQAQDHRVTTIRSFSGRAARGLRNRYVEAM